MDDQFGRLLTQIRGDPASMTSRDLLRGLLAGLTEDIPLLTSTDAARLRAFAQLLDDVAQHMPGRERAQAKTAAAECGEVADFLDWLGRAARAGFGE